MRLWQTYPNYSTIMFKLSVLSKYDSCSCYKNIPKVRKASVVGFFIPTIIIITLKFT